jgi:type IV pilus assembly protein PilM
MSKDNETSIWKKEITFRRKPKEKSVPVLLFGEQAAAPAKPAGETSIWKKEITFRRKPKAKAEPEVQVPLAASAPQPVAPVAPAPQPGAPAPGAPVSSPQTLAPSTEPLPPPLTPASAVAPPVLPPVTPEAAPPVLPPVTPQAAAPMQPPVTPQAAPPVVAPVPPAAVEPDQFPPTVAAPPPQPAPRPPAEQPQPEAPPPPEPEQAAVVVPRPAVEDPPELEAEPLPPSPSKPSRRERKQERREDDRHAKELVGLKLGASQIAAAQVINKGGPKVVRMARMPLQRGVVVGGELREPEELAAALKTFFKTNKLPRNCVRLGISNNRIGVRTFEISGISDPNQLANAVRFRAQETLPIPLDEAVLDYRILEDRVGDDGVRVCRVLLVVAHKELVERYVAACKKAGLKLVGIDLEAFALLRALSDPAQTPGEDAAVVCVSIGHDRSTLAVSDGHLCEFTRVLAWGGAALDAALARVLDLTPSAVVPIKHALRLGEHGAAAGLDARHADEARQAMVAELQSFARELVASLRFYQEQPKSLGIVEILITGGAAACGGLGEELERLIGIPVRVADPLVRVKTSRTVQAEHDPSTSSMAVAVGLGIED